MGREPSKSQMEISATSTFFSRLIKVQQPGGLLLMLQDSPHALSTKTTKILLQLHVLNVMLLQSYGSPSYVLKVETMNGTWACKSGSPEVLLRQHRGNVDIETGGQTAQCQYKYKTSFILLKNIQWPPYTKQCPNSLEGHKGLFIYMQAWPLIPASLPTFHSDYSLDFPELTFLSLPFWRIFYQEFLPLLWELIVHHLQLI